jgi:hypothetical protein
MTEAGLPWPGNDTGKRRALFSFDSSTQLYEAHAQRVGDASDRHPGRRRLAKLDPCIAPRRDPCSVRHGFLRQLALRTQAP